MPVLFSAHKREIRYSRLHFNLESLIPITVQESWKKLSQIIDHHVSAMRFQLFRVSLPRHADDEPKSALRARSDTRDGVLDHCGTLRHHPKHLGSLQKRIGRRLTGKTLLDQHIAIDTRIEKIVDLCCLQDRLAILTRGHHCGFDTDP